MPKIKSALLFGLLRSPIGRNEVIVESLEKLIRDYGELVIRMFFTEDGGGHSFNYLIIDGRSYSISELRGIMFS